jgi:hypothetical protein
MATRYCSTGENLTHVSGSANLPEKPPHKQGLRNERAEERDLDRPPHLSSSRGVVRKSHTLRS